MPARSAAVVTALDTVWRSSSPPVAAPWRRGWRDQVEVDGLLHDRVERRAGIGDGLRRQRPQQLGLPRRDLLGPQLAELDVAEPGLRE
jgi:hypothetical protein